MEQNKFKITVELPLSHKLVEIYELNNKDLLTISKFTQNNDFANLLGYIKHFIQDFDTIPYTLDKVYALIALRSIFIGDEIRVPNRENIPVNISLNSILGQLDSYEDENIYTLNINKFTIEFRPVSQLPDDGSSIYDCIKTISFCGVTVDDNIDMVLDRLPPDVFSSINKSIINFYNSYSSVVFIPGNDSVKLNPLIVNFTNDSLKKFILSIYGNSIQNILENLYVFAQHFKNVDFFSLSPLDSQILINILHRELKESNKEPEQTHQNPLSPFL